ncbi:MAG: hypothetical protein LW863_20670, partial [Flammeovirgaceae bacterium]|nr:hypothetical protein [Flammeovirgaceae bacterium]
MPDILYDEVPSLDLADFTGGDPAKKKKFVSNLGEAYNNIGFVAIRNHYLTDDLSAQLYDMIKKFFALPDEVKKKYEIEGLAGQRGYIGKGKEHAKGRNTGDLKEFFHVGQEVKDGDPIKNEYPDIDLVMGGDFNLVLGQGDSQNRSSNNAERRSRKFIQEQNNLLNLRDSYRINNKSGGFTWSRGSCMSRLDLILIEKDLASLEVNTKLEWGFDI